MVVQLANGQAITLPERVRLSIDIASHHIWHSFFTMPTLGNSILLGVDFWAKVGHALSAPPSPVFVKTTPPAAVTEGLIRRTSEEDQRLRESISNRRATPSRM